MKSRLMLIIILCTTILAVLACGSTSYPEKVSVDSSFSGSAVEIAIGGKLTVTLESNASTGYQWGITNISDPTVLEEFDQQYINSPQATQNGSPIVGAPGTEEWTFRTLRKGTCTISMGYSRPWESSQPAETFSLTVLVK